MVKLRLSRIGKRKQPYYRIVAMNVTAPRNGRALAEVGTYDPLHASVKVDEERAIEWLNNGAQMTETVAALFDSQGILARWKGQEGTVREDALSHDKPKRRRKLAASAAVAEETPAEETAATPVVEEAPAEETVEEAPAEEASAEAPAEPVEEAPAEETPAEEAAEAPAEEPAEETSAQAPAEPAEEAPAEEAAEAGDKKE